MLCTFWACHGLKFFLLESRFQCSVILLKPLQQTFGAEGFNVGDVLGLEELHFYYFESVLIVLYLRFNPAADLGCQRFSERLHGCLKEGLEMFVFFMSYRILELNSNFSEDLRCRRCLCPHTGRRTTISFLIYS